MAPIPIKLGKNSDEKFRELLKKSINRLAHERQQDSLWPSYNERRGIGSVASTIRVSLDTKNKLKKFLKPRETYEELIQRLMETNVQLKEEITYLRELDKEHRHLIKYIESGFKREKKTLTYHPDLKIEYSYNESKAKSYGDFSFNLEIDNFVLQGRQISEREGIRTIQTIDILKSLKKIDLKSDVKGIIRRKELMLESEEEFIKSKYLLYFKILFFIINKKIDKKIDGSSILSLDFWKELYGIKSLSNGSLEEDVIQKLKKFKLELDQIEVDKERKLWHIKLKE